jgi:hypothetical protein
VDPEVASLGREIGKIDVRCDLVKTQSKWHTPLGPLQEPPPDYPLSGLLYFEFQFRERKPSILMDATIKITLKDADPGIIEENVRVKEKIYVKDSHPGTDALKPVDTLMQQVSETRGVKVDPKISVPPYVDVKGLEYSKKAESKSEVEETWSFSSGRPSGSSDKAEFFWRRNTPTDWTLTDRGYDGALILCRQDHKDIRVKVFVTVSAKNNLNLGREKTAKTTISRECGMSTSEKSLFDGWAANLPNEIRDRNVQRGNPRKRTL